MTLPPPDTHCWDEDTSKDVWSHSAGLKAPNVRANLTKGAADEA